MSSAQSFGHVYGPVRSRRFGLSLGLDLIPHKLCSLDCIYCQVGRTTERVIEPRQLADNDRVVAEVQAALERGPAPDVITLAGSGEPTLHAGLGALASALREVTAVPLCLLTNGTLLWRPEVAAAALALDILAPSLDAADAKTFRRVNRPHPELDFERVLAGLQGVCHKFTGECRLEILLVRGLNDSPESLDALARLASSLDASSVDLNTVARPPAYRVQGLDRAAMEAARRIFAASGCRARIVAEAAAAGPEGAAAGSAEPGDDLPKRVAALLARRPSTADQIASALAVSADAVRQACARGVAAGTLREEQRDGRVFYVVATK